MISVRVQGARYSMVRGVFQDGGKVVRGFFFAYGTRGWGAGEGGGARPSRSGDLIGWGQKKTGRWGQ